MHPYGRSLILGNLDVLQYLVVTSCIVAEAQTQAFFVDGSSMSDLQVTSPALHTHVASIHELCAATASLLRCFHKLA